MSISFSSSPKNLLSHVLKETSFRRYSTTGPPLSKSGKRCYLLTGAAAGTAAETAANATVVGVDACRVALASREPVVEAGIWGSEHFFLQNLENGTTSMLYLSLDKGVNLKLKLRMQAKVSLKRKN